MRDYLVCIIGIAIVGLACFLEVEGVFLYSGYTFVKALGLLLAVVFSASGISFVRKHKLAPGLAALLLSVVLLVSGWMLGTLATTPRKRFYLLAEGIRPNDTIDSVKAKLSGYNSWSQREGYISFNFASGPGTTDVIVVQYDPKTSKILSSALSLD